MFPAKTKIRHNSEASTQFVERRSTEDLVCGTLLFAPNIQQLYSHFLLRRKVETQIFGHKLHTVNNNGSCVWVRISAHLFVKHFLVNYRRVFIHNIEFLHIFLPFSNERLKFLEFIYSYIPVCFHSEQPLYRIVARGRHVHRQQYRQCQMNEGPQKKRHHSKYCQQV